MRAGSVTALCVAAALSCAAAPAAGQAPPGSPEPLPAVLSNEQDLTRWAHANERAYARNRPSTRGRRVGRLRFQTEDGYPEVYVALLSHVDANGRTWVQVRLPRRPNGRKGWVRLNALGGFNIVRTRLEVDRRRLRATLYRSGEPVWSAPVGVGRRGRRTPAGRFYIRERLKPPPGTIYGTWAFGTSAYSDLTDWPGGGVVGIHGTNQPGLIPGRPSNGCIRLRNRDINRLARLMPIGTPVHVR